MSVNLYPAVAGVEKSKNYKVYVNGKELFVYDAQVVFDGWDELRMVYHPYISSYVSFDADEEVIVLVEPLYCEKATSVKIQPSSYGISARIEENGIVFHAPKAGKYCVTVNGEENRMLMLFINPPEDIKPDTDDEAVRYFGPGVHIINDTPHNEIILKSGETLYLDDGAVVYGRISAQGCENISIKGHGILCGTKNNGRWGEWLRPMVGSREELRRKNLVEIFDCKNIEIDGVTFIDSDGWFIKTNNCDNIKVNNIKIIGYQSNSDGTDFCSSRNVEMKDSFIRTSDDCIVLKAYDGCGKTKNVRVSGCVVWADRANALEIGHEIGGGEVCGVVFSDIDIINCVEPTYGYHAIDITNADIGAVHDITYDNIRIENCARIAGFRMRRGRFSNKNMTGIGEVYDIHLKNIFSDVDRAIFVSGADEEHLVHDITFENIVICGNKLESLDSVRHNFYVKDIILKDKNKDISVIPEQITKFYPLDIRSMSNMTIGRDRGIYSLNDEDWVTLPSGIHTMEGVPFWICGQGYDPDGVGDYKRVVIPPGRIGLPFGAVLELDEKANYIYFLHTTVNTYSAIDLTAAVYRVTYEDGMEYDIKVKNLNDSNDLYTWSLAGWQPTWGKLRFYIMPWKNPYPDKNIRSIEMLDGELHEMQILLAITLA